MLKKKSKISICLLCFFLLTSNVFALTWSQQTIKDDFKGTTSDILVSNFVEPNAKLDFPYQNLKVRIVIDCNNRKALFLMFNMHPNLTGGTLREDLSSNHSVDVRIDGAFDKLMGTIGSNGTIFSTISQSMVKKILSSKEFLVQFDHYAGTRHYKFDLSSMPKNCK